VALLDGQGEDPESLELAVQALIRLIQFGARTGMDRPAAERLEQDARALAERLGDPGQRGMIFVVTGAARLLAGDLQGALDHYLEAARMADEAEDPAVRAALWMPIPLPMAYLGRLADGLAASNQSVSACAAEPERGARLMGFSPLARAFQYRGGILTQMGRLPEAAADLERALALARSRAEPETVSWTLALLPQLAWLTGEQHDTSALAAEAVQLAEETGNVVCLVLALEASAVAHLTAGRPGEAVAACERALAEARAHRSGLFEEAAVLTHLAGARLAAHNPSGALVAAEEAVAVARRQGARVVECRARLTRATVLSATGPDRADAVAADLEAALSLALETGAATYEPFIREELGRLRGDENERRQARRLYTEIGAIGQARRLGAEPEVSPQRVPG
jgi:tetratricopeptide (TPR) repeat protein